MTTTADRMIAFLRRLLGVQLPPSAWEHGYLPPSMTNLWSPLARMVIAINIDKATPGGIR